MKITFNIKKKHLYILTIILVIFGIGIVISTPYPDTNPQSHDELWTKIIYGKNVDNIQIRDNLILAPGKGISLNGVLKTSWDVAATTSPFDKDNDGYIDYAQVDNTLKNNGELDCNDNNNEIYPNSNVWGKEDMNCNGILELQYTNNRYNCPNSCGGNSGSTCTPGWFKTDSVACGQSEIRVINCWCSGNTCQTQTTNAFQLCK